MQNKGQIMKNFIEDFKVYAINSGALMISFTQVESVLKILLLIISIVYTLIKMRHAILNKKDETDK
jgi:hypothetical protein